MKTIHLIVSNTFLGEEIAQYKMPFNPRKAIFGYYSDLWKSLRLSHSKTEKIDKNFICTKILFTKGNDGRAKVIFPSGASLDMPYEINKTDCEIINLHLKALRLSRNFTGK